MMLFIRCILFLQDSPLIILSGILDGIAQAVSHDSVTVKILHDQIDQIRLDDIYIAYIFPLLLSYTFCSIYVNDDRIHHKLYIRDSIP
jgi:hypothetical protein